MAQENSNDLPVIVGAVVVGLIAIGIFYFTKAEPVPAPTPATPVTGPLNAQAVAPVMIPTTGASEKPPAAPAGEAGAAPAAGGGGGGGMTAVPTPLGGGGGSTSPGGIETYEGMGER